VKGGEPEEPLALWQTTSDGWRTGGMYGWREGGREGGGEAVVW